MSTLSLEDYLPRTAAPQSRVPLPPQPQPNPAIVQQPTPMHDWLDTCRTGVIIGGREDD